MMADRIRVLAVDDQPLIRFGFRMVLEATDDIEVVGEAADGAEAIERTRQLRPDVILMDVRMPVIDGIAATRSILETSPGIRILVLTTFDLDEYAFGALRAGASGFLLKDARADELADAIRSVHAGDAVTSPRITRRMIEMLAHRLPQSAGPTGLQTLTEREGDVLGAIADGLNNAEIAARLFVTESTVKTHVGRVLAKIGARDRVHAVIYAYEHGLVT